MVVGLPFMPGGREPPAGVYPPRQARGLVTDLPEDGFQQPEGDDSRAGAPCFRGKACASAGFGRRVALGRSVTDPLFINSSPSRIPVTAMRLPLVLTMIDGAVSHYPQHTLAENSRVCNPMVIFSVSSWEASRVRSGSVCPDHT